MDSHAFSDPVPVSGADIPTWEVEVIRVKGNVIVGQLLVNNISLPPRKGRKKAVVWQLPADGSQTPRFGEHEKKRLWELFKEQKKERRRQSKLQQRESETADDEQSSRVMNGRDANGSETANEEQEEPEIIELEGPKRRIVKGREDASEGKAILLNESPSSCTDIRRPESPLQKDSSHSRRREGASAVVSPPPAIATTAALPPPPPGFSPPIAAPLPSVAQSPALPATPTGSLPTNRSRLYFVPPPNSQDGSLGMAVVQVFEATVGQGMIDPWLAHYNSNAHKSVLVGAAQVTVSTADSRREQWSSIVREGANSWDVTGWTSHESSPSAIPVVLTGTTLQATGPFVYTLSLTLMKDEGLLEPRYSITNDILTLFKVQISRLS